MSKKSAPVPDYTGAANATAAGNLEAARAAAAANRVTQITPYGSLVYSHDPNAATPDDGWIATQTLAPAEQQKLDQTNALTNALLGVAGQGVGNVSQLLANGGQIDQSKLTQMPMQGQAVQDAIMSRLQPTMDRQRASLNADLANQGIGMGSAAYNNAMNLQGQQENDARVQAGLQGISTALAARQQQLSEAYTAQTRPLDILNALRTGANVQNPSFVNIPQQQTTAGADLLGAAQLTGQADLANQNAQNAFWNQLLGSSTNAASAYMLAS